MYDELVKRLREKAGAFDYDGRPDIACDYEQAADAIEKLKKALEAVNDAHNEGYDVGYWAGRRDYEPKWIPMTERLPETGVDVLVMFPHNMAVASRDMGEWVVNSGDGWCTDVNLSDDEKEPTYWMPLPEPPKEE